MTRRLLHTLATLLLTTYLPVAAQDADIDVLLNEDLSTEESFDCFTVVNANDDSQTWALGLQGACIRRTSSISHDDWLITPEIALRPGRTYTLSYTAKCIVEGREERLAVLIGQGTMPTDFTTIVAAERGFSQKADEQVVQTFSVATSGLYRLALHDVSPKGEAQSFYVRDLSVSVPQSPLAPQPATDLAIVPDESGLLRATINFRAPSLTRNGSLLTAISSIEVWRVEQLVATISQPMPGQQLSVNDEGEGMEQGGMTSYTVRTLNDEGRSSATASAYIGEDYPKAPATATVRDDGQHVVVEWQPVSEGIRGYRVNAANITYNIEDAATGDLLASNVSGNSYALTEPANEGPLKLHQYVVYAHTSMGDGPSVGTNRIISGQVVALPLSQSFADEQWLEGGQWWTSYEQSSWDQWQRDAEASDADGASLLARPYSHDERMGLNTAKLSLVGTQRPCAVFSHKAEPGQSASISLWADVLPQGAPTLLYQYDYASVPASSTQATATADGTWQRVAVDLSAYKELPYVVLMLVAENEPGVALSVDDIAVYDVPTYDLAASIALPKKTRTGKTTDIAVQVKNCGSQSVADYTLQLYAAGQLFHTETALSLPAYGCKTLHFSRTALVTDPAQLAIEVRLICSADADASNNSATATMRVEQTTLPVVDYLSGHDTGSTVELTWYAPEQGIDYTTEDFEGYDPFATDLAPWTTVDADGEPIFELSGVSFPQNAKPMSFVAFNPEMAGWSAKDNPTTVPHSGSQYAACFVPADWDLANDDWLISPELTAGEEQTVSFFARSVSSYYGGDGFDILYSTTGNAPADFVYKTNEAALEATENRWTEFFADLPEEARYFAIHYNSPGSVGLLVDDITYLAPTPEPTGYNIYRDLKRIAHVDAATTSFTDTTAPNGHHTYYVTATYGDDESDLSAPYMATVATGVASVAMPPQQTPVTLHDLQGRPLTGEHLRPGLYLRGGKKIIIK